MQGIFSNLAISSVPWKIYQINACMSGITNVKWTCTHCKPWTLLSRYYHVNFILNAYNRLHVANWVSFLDYDLDSTSKSYRMYFGRTNALIQQQWMWLSTASL